MSDESLWPLDDDTVAGAWDEAVALADSDQADRDIPDPPFPPYAATILDPPSPFKVLYGGRAAGRSWSVARKLLLRAARRKTRILCAREIQKSIKDSVHQLLRDQIDLLGLRGYTVTEHEINHANGSLFVFRGLRHSARSLKSLEGIDIVWVEEAEAISKDSWSFLIPTVRKEDSEIWVNFNPDQETDPTYQMFVAHPRPDAVVLKVGWEDNPFISAKSLAEKDHMYRVDPEAASWVWGGLTRAASDAQILRGKWRQEAFEPEPGWQGPYQGMDFGFANDPTTLLQVYLEPLPKLDPANRLERPRYNLRVRREAYKVGLELDHTAAFVKAAVPGCEHTVTRADSAEPATISYLQRHGLQKIQGVKKWAGSVEEGVRFLRSFEAIVVHPDCQHTLTECRLYSFKTDPLTGEVRAEILDRHNHCIDAIRYALAPMIIPGRRHRVWFPGMDEEEGALADAG